MKKLIVVLTLVSLCGFLSGCKVTIDDYEIIYRNNLSKDSKNSSLDKSYGDSRLETTTFEEIGEDTYIRKGPYKLSAGAKMRTHKQFGEPKELLINKAILELNSINKPINIIDLTNKRWKTSTQKITNRGETYTIYRKGQYGQLLDIDFASLKEVIFYIEYTGIYEDGTKRSY